MLRTVIHDGPRTLVDDTDYNLSRSEAIMELLNGKNILAQDYPDYTSDDISDWCPEAQTIHGADFKGQSIDEIAEYLKSYYRFGKVPVPVPVSVHSQQRTA